MNPIENPDVYRTIKFLSEGIFKDKGSKFYSIAYPVFAEEEIKLILKETRKKYFDATHHCYAYRLGAEKKIFRASDDGEPGGSAGLPILNIIQSNELSNILIIVIRYYGGIKLGVPGLIHAYKTAAQDAIANAKIIEKTENNEIYFSYPYLSMNQVMKLIKDENLTITLQKFDTCCELSISVRKRDFIKTVTKLLEIEGLEIKK